MRVSRAITMNFFNDASEAENVFQVDAFPTNFSFDRDWSNEKSPTPIQENENQIHPSKEKLLPIDSPIVGIENRNSFPLSNTFEVAHTLHPNNVGSLKHKSEPIRCPSEEYRERKNQLERLATHLEQVEEEIWHLQQLGMELLVKYREQVVADVRKINTNLQSDCLDMFQEHLRSRENIQNVKSVTEQNLLKLRRICTHIKQTSARCIEDCHLANP